MCVELSQKICIWCLIFEQQRPTLCVRSGREAVVYATWICCSSVGNSLKAASHRFRISNAVGCILMPVGLSYRNSEEMHIWLQKQGEPTRSGYHLGHTRQLYEEALVWHSKSLYRKSKDQNVLCNLLSAGYWKAVDCLLYR